MKQKCRLPWVNLKLLFWKVGTRFCLTLSVNIPPLLFPPHRPRRSPARTASAVSHLATVWGSFTIHEFAHRRFWFSFLPVVPHSARCQPTGRPEWAGRGLITSLRFSSSHVFVSLFISFSAEEKKLDFSWCQSLSRKHTLLDSGSAEKWEDQCTVGNVSLRTKASSVWQIKSYLWKSNWRSAACNSFHTRRWLLRVFCSFSANQVHTFALVTHPNELQVPPEAHMSDIQSRLPFTGTASFSSSPRGNVLSVGSRVIFWIRATDFDCTSKQPVIAANTVYLVMQKQHFTWCEDYSKEKNVAVYKEKKKLEIFQNNIESENI